MAWLIRVLAQVSVAVGCLLYALARLQAGDEAAAEAHLRRALKKFDRITAQLKARRRADLARAARLGHGVAGEAMEPVFVAATAPGRVIPIRPVRFQLDRFQLDRFQLDWGDGGVSARPAGVCPTATLCLPGRGGWRDPPGLDARRRVSRSVRTAAHFVTIS